MIPLNPRTKKNSLQILYKKAGGKGVYKMVNGRFKYLGIPFLDQSEIFLQYEQDAGWFLRKPLCPINTPVNVRCLFYRDSERRCDLTNLLEAVDDILIKYKVLADDNFKVIVSHDGSRVFVDRDNPRTEIYIEKY